MNLLGYTRGRWRRLKFRYWCIKNGVKFILPKPATSTRPKPQGPPGRTLDFWRGELREGNKVLVAGANPWFEWMQAAAVVLIAVVFAVITLTACSPRIGPSHTVREARDSSTTIRERTVTASVPGDTARAYVLLPPDCADTLEFHHLIHVPDTNDRAQLRITRDALNRVLVECAARPVLVRVPVRDTLRLVQRDKAETIVTPCPPEKPSGVAPFWRVWAIVATSVLVLLIGLRVLIAVLARR